MEVKRFDVFLINLDPTIDHEIQKSRPCVVISPDQMNNHISTVVIAPMTTTIRNYPTRVNCIFQNTKGQVVLDQIRTVDKIRLMKKLGKVQKRTQENIISILQEMFAA